jgi:predicted dehydrogenase
VAVEHLSAFKRAPGCRLHGVFDVNRESASRRAVEFGIPVTYETVEELIGECDVVDICTPPQTHAGLATQAIEAGRHVLIEKPVVITVEEWTELKEVLRRHAATLTVVHNLKFRPSIRQAKRWIEKGRIGTLVSMHRHFLTDPVSDRMLTAAGHWSHRLPGGRWSETIPHELYLLYHFFGRMDLAAVCALPAQDAGSGARAEEVHLTFREGRRLATVHYSSRFPLNRRYTMLRGTGGVVTIDLPSDMAALSRHRYRTFNRAVGGLAIDAAAVLARWLPDRAGYAWRRLARRTAHTELIREFGLYLQGQRPALTPVDEIDFVVEYCDRIGREIDRQTAV